MTSRFVHDAPAPRVVFGAGTVTEVPAEAERLGGRRLLVISTGSAQLVADTFCRHTAAGCVARITKVAMHVPAEVADAAVAAAADSRTDLIVCFGGGSAIGLAKAVAKDTALPILAVPTTYAGSEMTSIWGRTEGGRKRTGRDPSVLPKTVIYDPELTLGLPASLSATSGMNAVAHGMEAVYAPDATPVTTLLATTGLSALANALPRVVDTPSDLDARTDAFYGAWLSGWVLGATSMGLHHTLCHVLGGTFGLPHSAVHSAVLPYVIAWNQVSAPEGVAAASPAWGGADPAAALWDLATRIGAPTSLEAIGFRIEDITETAQIVNESPPPNPRAVSVAGVTDILRAAYRGVRPDAGDSR